MKTKRVSRLLACVLASSMCVAPVAAASTTGGTLTSDVTVNTATVKATFPTALNLKVNPLVNTSGTGISVNEYVASEELVIGNSTSDNAGAGVALRCTAVAQITKAAEDVQLNYNSFTPDSDSTKKKIFMQMAEADGSAGEMTASSNGTYGANNKTAVTKIKSQLQFTIGAPTSGKATVYNGFAITGKANPNADWKKGDVSVSVVYNVKPVQSNATNRPIPTLAAASGTNELTSANATTTDYSIATATELTAAVMKDATVTHVQVHSPENLFADMLVPLPDERVTITYTDDASNAEYHSCAIAFTKNKPLLINLAKNYAGKSFDVMVCLSDGRRLISKIAVEK